ncbi:MAG: hypothetical protein KatS3mg101_1133 [Patescibacteria group bacterium]|nr:MAG: hypothetical protein KatS3mg101_1133 [Patescibacteria group bacterium]
MTIKKRVFGRSQFSNEIKNLPQEYGDRMLMQYPLIDKGNIGEEPANKIYKMYHVPLFAPMHRSLLMPFYHVMITTQLDNPIQEEEFMEHIINYKSDIGDYFFEHIVNAIKEAQENHYVVQIANPFEFSFFWLEKGRFFFRNTSPIVLSPYAAPYSRSAIFMSEGYSDSLSFLFTYVMAENVEKKLAINNLSEWAIKMNYLYHVKAIMGEYTDFASEKYMYETYKGDLLDIEEQIIESVYESLDTGDMDYDPPCPAS